MRGSGSRSGEEVVEEILRAGMGGASSRYEWPEQIGDQPEKPPSTNDQLNIYDEPVGNSNDVSTSAGVGPPIVDPEKIPDWGWIDRAKEVARKQIRRLPKTSWPSRIVYTARDVGRVVGHKLVDSATETLEDFRDAFLR